MSLTQTQTTVQYELPEVGTMASVTTPQAASRTEVGIENGVPIPSLRRRIFHVAPSNVMGRYRKLIVTVLIITRAPPKMISNIVGIAAGLRVSELLGVTNAAQANWLFASYGLTQGTFVLISGRLGAVFGHKNMLLGGGAWFVFWSLINAFCDDFISFNIVRALTGIGGALILPNAVAMIGITNPPGKTRNLSLGFFGASAPIGGWFGSILCGLFIQYASWHWFFYTMAIMGGCVFGTLAFLLPPEIPVDKNGKVDWVGATLGCSGLIVFNFVWNQAPAVGWNTPYEIALLVLSIVLLAVFALWEQKWASAPIMPLDIWKAPSFLPLVFVTLLSFMSFGTTLWYSTAWEQNIRHWDVLEFAIGWTPFGIFATIAACFSAWLIPRLAAQYIMAIGVLTLLVSSIIIVTMPEQQSYWAQYFPATILNSFCPDLVFTAAQIIASNSVRREEQGIAGSLIGILNLYGNSLGVGFAGTVEEYVNKGKPSLVVGYRAALYFGIVIGVVALIVDLWFVRMAKDEREGWTDPRDESEPVLEVADATGFSLET
ncbi:MAG: hypothetical protein M1834_008876 [Cirrosporium novae-zelandiae]|nr:MAG: hypothetical protein M1834_008876 [Cirrosporium novae-zelandiae]